MPPQAGRIINNDAYESDSDVSILDDEPSIRIDKGKGKGKAVDRNPKNKGKSKAKEVRGYVVSA